MDNRHQLRQFLLLVFALLLPCFGLWTAVAGWIAIPAIGFNNMIFSAWMPEIVQSVFTQDGNSVLMTRFGTVGDRVVPATQADSALGFILNTRILSYSIPFYTALHFATARERYLGDYCIGLLVLYALLVFGMVCLGLKDLMLQLGSTFLEHPEAPVPPASVIAILYQLNVLIVPTIGPIMLWAWQGRDTALLKSLLQSVRAARPR